MIGVNVSPRGEWSAHSPFERGRTPQMFPSVSFQRAMPRPKKLAASTKF